MKLELIETIKLMVRNGFLSEEEGEYIISALEAKAERVKVASAIDRIVSATATISEKP